MAVRVQNLPRKTSRQDSIHQMPHFTGNHSPWWNSQEQQFSQTLSKNIHFRVEHSPPRCQEVETLGLQLRDKGSPSTLSSSQSPHELTTTTKTNSQDQCVSSESVQTQSYQKHVGDQVNSAFLMSNPEFSVNPSVMDMNQSTGHISFGAYADPYFSGLFNAYGSQALIQSQMAGMAPNRILLPPDLAQDGPIYVNAKQYHGILRRRQMRAKLEAQNRLLKNRKPYLHESRHLHAVNRVRGTGGRFLSKKEQQQSVDPTPSRGSASSSVHSHRAEVQKSKTKERNDGPSNGNLFFQQPADHNKISSVTDQMALSMLGSGGFTGNEHRYRAPSFQ